MANAEYWKRRFKLIEEAQHQQGLQCYANIEKQYFEAQKQIESKINAWYQRFADNNQISLIEARRLLNTNELEELRWNVDEYIRYGKANAVSKEWMKELENASAKAHISRLESIKLQMQQSLEVLFGNQLDIVDTAIRDIYGSGYLRTAFEIQKGIGVGWSLSIPNDNLIAKVINKPWAADGRNFSDRIWANKQKLINELNATFTQNIITGADPRKTIDVFSRKLDVSKQNAGRLVMTEQAAFGNAAQHDCFKALDVEQFEVVETLDSHTCSLCGSMDGKHFPMSQFEVGMTAPPFHPNCRGCTCPYFDDEFDSVGKRAARGESGKTYYVPSDMTYKEWQKSFVDGGDKSDLHAVKKDDTVKLKKKIADADAEIADLKKQFSDTTDGYSYDDWFKDFNSIEDGYGDVTEADEPNVNILKNIQRKIQDLIQQKNQWKSQLPVLGGQGTPMNITDALKGANHNYASGTQYGVNCQRCVQTYELRRRGYDVEALPKPKKNNTIIWGNECFVDSSGNTPSFTFNQSEKSIRNTLENAPDGSRYIIYAAWKKRSAHVFIAEKENGIIRYIDPQPNKDDVEYYFSLAKKNKFGILRVDDKDITTDISILSATVRW
nr:MAG TPA: minor capsid protein [Caudoviricetes sp.]